MLIDTHCHLHDKEFFSEEQAEEILKRAREKGVEKIICVGTSHEDSLAARDFASTHNNVYWTYGIHPEGASGTPFPRPAPSLPSLRGSVAKKLPVGRNGLGKGASEAPVAIGEVGLDYHYEGYNREAQNKLFEQMLQLAKDNNLPLSFHVREVFDDFFPVVSNFPKVHGVVHSFSDNKRNLKRILNETDFYVGVNGMATYSTLPTPPLNRILLETDAPFLTPVPFRGMINESGYIYEIAKWLSNKLAVDFDEVKNETTKNAEKLFDFECASRRD